MKCVIKEMNDEIKNQITNLEYIDFFNKLKIEVISFLKQVDLFIRDYEDKGKDNLSSNSKFRDDYNKMLSQLDHLNLKFIQLDKENESHKIIISNLNNLLDSNEHLIKQIKEENIQLILEKSHMKNNVKLL